MKTLLPLALMMFVLAPGAFAQVEINPPPPAAKNSRWVVIKKASPIDDSPSITMSLAAVEHQGAQYSSPRLIVRLVESKLDVLVAGGGYIGIEAPKVTLRWDSAPAQNEYWVPSASGDAAFSRNPRLFILRAMKSARVVVRVHEFAAPATAIFDLSTLNEELDKLPELKRAIHGKP